MNGEGINIKNICIGYATQTGNSYELALQATLSLKDKISVFQQINENFNFQDNNLYIFFISTTGQGDPPYSMRIFWKNLMNKNYRNLNKVKFCVYGLGDRSYGDNFNITSRKLRQRFLMLQAEQVINIGLGDEQDPNGCFDQYFNNFYPALQKYIEKIRLESINFVNFTQLKKTTYKDNKNYKKFIIVQQKLLSSVEGRNTYWITLQLAQKIQIQIGDILEIYPQNNDEVVKQMIQYFSQNNLNNQSNMQKLIQYLKQTANLCNLLNFTFFTQNKYKNQLSLQLQQTNLYQMIDSKLDENIQKLFKDKLKQLGQDYNEYFNYIKKFRRNIREVIIDFNLKIPYNCILQRLGSIISRKYSIAEISAQKNQISLLIKLQKFKVSNNRIVNGLCSHDLSLSPLKQIRMGKIIRNGQFQLNFGFDKNVKIVMISLGTGIAPFLSILDQASKNKNNWQISLFHSNRYQKQCPLQSSTTEPLILNKQLKLFLTFTRQKQPKQNRRLPVLITQNIGLFKEYQAGKIMICGGKQFCDLICRIFQENLGFNTKKMKKQRIICIENW